MATTSASCAPTNSSDAHFRAWINFVKNVFVNGGWVQTADTGQIDFATALAPAAVNTKVGYAIFRMNDALQATHPVFVKFWFGSANFTKDDVGLWFSLGRGTDGAGNFVDSEGLPAKLFSYDHQSVAPMRQGVDEIISHPCFGSATTSRAVFCLFEALPEWSDSPPGSDSNWTKSVPDHIGGAANYTFVWGIERAKDWSGNDIGDYVSLFWSNGFGDLAAVMRKNHYVGTSLSDQSNLASEGSGLSYALAQQGPVTGARDTPPTCFKDFTFAQPPGINFMLSRIDFQDWDHVTGDYISGNTVDVTIYGVTRRYRVTAGMRGGSETAMDANAHVRILYE